jgi:ligand-binding sensor domain-containing protein
LAKELRFPTILLGLFSLVLIFSGCSKGKGSQTTIPVLIDHPTATTVPFHTSTPSTKPIFTPSFTITPTITITPYPSQTPISPSWALVDHWPPANQARVLFVDTSGDVWSGGSGGLVHWEMKTGTPKIYTLDPTDPDNSNVTSLAQTPDGFVWVGTYGHGLYQFDGEHWQSFNTEDGLPGNYILDLAIDPSGKLLINLVTNKYLSEGVGWFGQFVEHEWLPMSDFDFTGRRLDAFIPAPNGEIWVSWFYQIGQNWDTAIYAYQPIKNEFMTRFSFNGPLVTMTIAPNGNAWVVTYQNIWRFQDGKWVYFVPPWNEKSSVNVTAMSVDQNGAAWFTTSFTYNNTEEGCGDRQFNSEDWGVYRLENNVWTHFTTEDGLADNMTCAITVGPDGDVWVGTADKGISHFNGHQWKSYSVP